MLLDIGLKFYAVPSRPNLGDLEVKVTDLEILCFNKFLVKVFVSLYLLTILMDLVDTLHVARYWSEVLRSTIMTQPG